MRSQFYIVLRIVAMFLVYLSLCLGISAQDARGQAFQVNLDVRTQNQTTLVSTIGEPVAGVQFQDTLRLISGFFPYALFVEEVSAVNDIAPVAGLTVYPNPVSRMLYLKLDNDQATQLTVRLYGVNGAQLDQYLWDAQNDTYQIPFGMRAPGVYILEVSDPAHLSQYKVVRQ